MVYVWLSWTGPIGWLIAVADNFTTFDLTGEFAFGEAFHCLVSESWTWILFRSFYR